ncbi:MAG: hypothetical protein HQL94_03995, partial [Magnetococcales bacterium]|nr:hypothetical protein [Magnetococcales bacterium]
DDITTGVGDDAVYAGAGADSVRLGEGSDVMFVNGSDLTDTLLDGGAGSDWLHFGYNYSGVAGNYSLSSSGAVNFEK